MTRKARNEGSPQTPGSAFLPYLHDMLAMGVPESTAIRWHNAIWMLKSHCEHMAEVIEDQTGDKDVLRESAMNARKAMSAMRPNSSMAPATSAPTHN